MSARREVDSVVLSLLDNVLKTSADIERLSRTEHRGIVERVQRLQREVSILRDCLAGMLYDEVWGFTMTPSMHRALKSAGVYNLEGLLKLCVHDVECIKGVGPQMMLDLHYKLKALGKKFKDCDCDNTWPRNQRRR